MRALRILLASIIAISVSIIRLEGVNAEWKKDSNGWWYSEENSYAIGWRQVGSVWYYFGDDGYMKKGWFCDNGTWYYANSNGAMQTGIIQVNGKTYYLASSGAMQIGDVNIGEETYSFSKSGEAIGNKIPQATEAFTGDGIITTLINTKDKSNTVEINLEANPTTGYVWKYKIENENIIKQESEQYKKNNDKSELLGSGGIYTWKFSGIKEGTTNVTFEYYRPWEKKAIKTKNYIFTVDKDLKISVKEQ